MGLIKRTVGHNAPSNVKLHLYTALVRSKLETCSQVWHGLCKKDKIKIEGVQRAATRYILSYPDMSYTDRMLKTKLIPLTYRRDMADVCMFYKCISNMYNIDVSSYFNFSANNTVNTRSTDDPTLLRIPYCKTSVFKNLYFNRIVTSWNALPLAIRCSTTISRFKNQLKVYLFELTRTFNPDCCCSLQTMCNCKYLV
jgi:hypothetical protein